MDFDNALKQVVASPSRNGNYLDLLCTDMKHELKQCSTEPGFSDHDAISASFEMRISATYKLKERVYWYFKNAYFYELNSSFKRVNWFVLLLQECSLEKNWKNVVRILNELIAPYVPTVNVTFSMHGQHHPRHNRRLRQK